jgi:hypothetical protein
MSDISRSGRTEGRLLRRCVRGGESGEVEGGRGLVRGREAGEVEGGRGLVRGIETGMRDVEKDNRENVQRMSRNKLYMVKMVDEWISESGKCFEKQSTLTDAIESRRNGFV